MSKFASVAAAAAATAATLLSSSGAGVEGNTKNVLTQQAHASSLHSWKTIPGATTSGHPLEETRYKHKNMLGKTTAKRWRSAPHGTTDKKEHSTHRMIITDNAGVVVLHTAGKTKEFRYKNGKWYGRNGEEASAEEVKRLVTQVRQTKADMDRCMEDLRKAFEDVESFFGRWRL